MDNLDPGWWRGGGKSDLGVGQSGKSAPERLSTSNFFRAADASRHLELSVRGVHIALHGLAVHGSAPAPEFQGASHLGMAFLGLTDHRIALCGG